MTRKKEREQVFCLIFEKCFRDDSPEEVLELATTIRDFEISDYIVSTFLGVYENVNEIDDIISKNLVNWKISRISKSTLALLRLAIFEMKFNSEIPESVTINEVVDLAKIYSDEKDASYINGVLGTVSKQG